MIITTNREKSFSVGKYLVSPLTGRQLRAVGFHPQRPRPRHA
jgi:hypothetical protein